MSINQMPKQWDSPKVHYWQVRTCHRCKLYAGEHKEGHSVFGVLENSGRFTPFERYVDAARFFNELKKEAKEC